MQTCKYREPYNLNNQDFFAYGDLVASFSSASLWDGNVNGNIRFLITGNNDLGEPL